MKTRIKQHNGKFFPQYNSWWTWNPIIVSVTEPKFNVVFEKSHYWIHEINAQRAIDTNLERIKIRMPINARFTRGTNDTI